MGLIERVRHWLRGSEEITEESPERHRVGQRGEREAVAHLKRRGYTILERNFRTKGGEIDVVAFRDGTVVFVEVRSVTGPARFDPQFTVGRRKQKRIARAAAQYASLHDMGREDVVMRFDVITVIFQPPDGNPDLKHIEGAFEAD